MRKFFELKINVMGKGKGTIIQLEADKNGVPFDQFWRNRYTDGDIIGIIPEKRETVKEKIANIETKTIKRGKKK
jgi:hypothetical protein